MSRLASRVRVLAALLIVAFASIPAAAGEGGRDNAPANECVESLSEVSAWCRAGTYSCTSTSRCTGAAVSQFGKRRWCPPGACTPWVPTCWDVKVWHTDEENDPTLHRQACPPVDSPILA